MTTLNGLHFIKGEWQGELKGSFASQNPTTDSNNPWQFASGTQVEAEQAAAAAHSAFIEYRRWSAERRAQLLDAMADAIDALGDTLTEVASSETALPDARLTGERGRTCGQLRLFAQDLRQPQQPVIIDTALPERTPLPKPDIRLSQLPLGPVAIFGASNFPLAFSAAGGDTASALAAGCPVVIKGHPAHPATTELVVRAMQSAMVAQGAPLGLVNLVQGHSPELSTSLVKAPQIRAVGFTGSLKVGRILADVAAARPEPIPFFGELGSINPQLLLADKLANAPQAMAAAQVQSMMMGQGQFCTSPGVVLVKQGQGLTEYLDAVKAEIGKVAPGTMLTKGIAQQFSATAAALQQNPLIEVLALGATPQSDTQTQAHAFLCSATVALANPSLLEENFGPSMLVVVADDDGQLLELINALPGQLTASIHGEDSDWSEHLPLIEALSYRVGRLIANQMPTGVEVCHAMQHGGPWPASTHSQSTSVGAEAIKRFTRPIAWQNMPKTLLPEALTDGSQHPQIRF